MRTMSWLPAKLKIIHLLVVMVALSAADALVSRSLLAAGLGHEANPFMRALSGGVFILVKTIGAVLAAVLLWDLHRRMPRLAEIVTVFIPVFFTGIVYWNLSIFLRA